MKRFLHIKYIVTIGYILLFLIAIWGLILLYQKFLDFSEINSMEKERSELLIIGNTLSILYDAESTKDLFNKNLAENYSDKYDAVMPEVFKNIDSLKHLSDDTVRIAKLDTIKSLLIQKRRNISAITLLLDSIEKAPRIIRITESSSVPPKLNENIRKYFVKKTQPNIKQENKDTVIVKKNTKNIFGRIMDAVKGKPDSTIIVSEKSSIENTEFIPVIDTMINMVRHYEYLDLMHQKELQLMLMKRQADMGNTNNNLTNRIHELLKSIEKEELERALYILRYKDESLYSAKRVVFIAAIMLVIIAFIFGAIYLRDLVRKQRYRMELEASNKKINELLHVREKMMYSISHDIKAPLNSILGYIELMNTKGAANKKALYLENMKQSGEHVLQLITNLLDYHKLESKKWVFKKINYNLCDVLESTANSFKHLANQKNLTWTFNNDVPADFSCHGDPFVLRQIITNLVSNAIKFTFSGGITLSSEIEQKNAQHFLHFSVVDTGVGISNAQKELIFKEFEQLKEDGTELVEGCGLGLGITKSLIEALDGELKVTSEKGRGSAFSFSIPLKKSSQCEETTEEMKTGISTNIDLSNIRILIIDDDPLQLKMTEEMLLLKKAQVTTISHPAHVLPILKEKQFDILLIDIQMPEINGFELVRKIRKLGIMHYAKTPIIALSAKSDVAESDIIQSGFSAFLNKPFSMIQLLEIIAKKLHLKIEKPQKPAPKQLPTVENLIEYVKEDADASLEIIQSFATNTGIDIQSLREEMEVYHWDKAGKIAHKILPLIKIVGDDTASSILSKMEQGTATTKEESQMILILLQRYIDEANTFLENHKKEA